MVALSVPTQVDGVRVHVDVHEVVDDLALDVVLHPVDKEAASHIHHLDEGQFPGRDNKQREQTNRLKAPGGHSRHCSCFPTRKKPQ